MMLEKKEQAGLKSTTASRDNLQPLTPREERRQTGRYVAGVTVLVITLLALHHVLLRGASTIAGLCIPAIIMASYILWVLYTVRRDRRKARLLASAMQLTEVISAGSHPGGEDCLASRTKPVETDRRITTAQREPTVSTSNST